MDASTGVASYSLMQFHFVLSDDNCFPLQNAGLGHLQHLHHGDERNVWSLQRAVPENWDEGERRGDLEVGKTLVDSVQVFTCCSPLNYSVHLDSDYDVIVLPNTKYSH